MPDWPQLADGQQSSTIGTAPTVSRGTTVTAAATAHVKGAYAVLSASTPHDADTIVVMFDDLAAGVNYLVDIAVGAATEQDIIPNLYVGGGTGSLVYGSYYIFHLQIPEGSRVTARCQASTLSSLIRCSILLIKSGFVASSPADYVVAFGAATATTAGVSIDPGGTANTKGVYSQIVASTSDDVREITIAMDNQLNTVRSSQSWLLDIAIGAATEQIILPDIALNCSTSPDIVVPQTFGPIPMCIPAGTRIAARAQSDGIDATDRLFGVIVYGAVA